MPPTITASPLDAAERARLTGRWELADGQLEVIDAVDHLQIRLEGQALLNLVVDDADVDRLTNDTERARAWVESALEGEFEVGVLERVWGFMEDRFGPVEAVDVLGTAPTWYASPTATWLRFRFRSAGAQIRRLHWDDAGRLYGVGGSVFYPAPVSVRCVGTGARTCTAMHPNLEIVSFRLERTGDGRAVLHLGGQRLDARRVSAGSDGGAMD